MANMEVAASRVAIYTKVTDILRCHPDGLHVDQISRLAGIESGKMARVLRALATKHVYKEGEAFMRLSSYRFFTKYEQLRITCLQTTVCL